MARLLKAFLLILAVLIIVAGGIYVTGNTLKVVVWLTAPSHGWDLTLKAAAPDYSQSIAWAARPDIESLATSSPKGFPARPGARAVDVFFHSPDRLFEWQRVELAHQPQQPHGREHQMDAGQSSQRIFRLLQRLRTPLPRSVYLSLHGCTSRYC